MKKQRRKRSLNSWSEGAFPVFNLCMSNSLPITETDIPRLGFLGERQNRPLIRPLSIESPSREVDTRSLPVVIPPYPISTSTAETEWGGSSSSGNSTPTCKAH
ncbi:hypothetical protein GLYMA_04G205650v4 [Glycine max]|nr:hypothetical protein GLYMA_04G205650v4 [Glycine max]KAH1112381.1 hypothetical protein GYH30_010585 [Glycine max]